MKVLVLVVSLLAAVSARPDIGLALRNQPPATSYGVPSGSYLPPFHHSTGFTGFQTSSGSTSQSSSSGASILEGSQFGNSYTTSGAAYHHSHVNVPAQVSRHVYFYAAPDEPADDHARVHIPVAPPRKNYKLIFIKAPSYAPPASHVYAPQQQDEEKTLVYVLVKKPDEGHDIVIPTPAPTKPSKPEVFFIKYKTKKEAEDKIAGTLHGTHDSASIAQQLDDNKALIDSITQDISAGSSAHQVITTDHVHHDHDHNHDHGHIGLTSGQEIQNSGAIISTSSDSFETQSKYGPAGASGPYKK